MRTFHLVTFLLFIFFSFQSPAQESGRLTYDLGVSSGKSGDVTYSEIDLGLNFFIQPFLAWRNAIFARFVSEADNIYGLDSSARFIFNTRLSERSGVTTFGGPGVRVPSEGDVVPFVEGGLIFKAGGLSLGGGAKAIFNKAIDEDAENDTQYFIILSGSGSL